jgi:cbb3-type cytochrome oxidase subunit 3
MNMATLFTVVVAIAFGYLMYRMLRPGARDRLEPFARIPLEDDQPLQHGSQTDTSGDGREAQQ